MAKHEILLGLTTTPASDWRGKVEEMKKFGIQRIALFPTFLKIEERKELYSLLEEIQDLEIPHVHLRNDMTMDEIQYFKERFKSEVFNIHPTGTRHDFSDDFTKFSSETYVENLRMVPKKEELSKYAGICIDFSHWENGTRKKSTGFDSLLNYNLAMLDRLKENKVGCCHVSGIKSKFNPINYLFQFDRHYFKKLSDFDYMSKYKQYLPKYVSLELENTLEEQIKVKQYLQKMLKI
ncbi:MAG: hypothetical protein ACD_5C00053G0001 [uncultured bacterium]|nr:MAG: hypothetical protein ACD_5C00053G0001 [uncultured bacterium]